MYAHIREDKLVGELFEALPPDDMYDETFIQHILEVPDGVIGTWRFVLPDGMEEDWAEWNHTPPEGSQFLPPEPDDSIDPYGDGDGSTIWDALAEAIREGVNLLE